MLILLFSLVLYEWVVEIVGDLWWFYVVWLCGRCFVAWCLGGLLGENAVKNVCFLIGGCWELFELEGNF